MEGCLTEGKRGVTRAQHGRSCTVLAKMIFYLVPPKSNMPRTETQRWTKPPANGQQCPYSGLRRTSTYRLINRSDGAIHSVSLKQPGTKRGNRLFSVPDLLAYLDRLAVSQQQLEAV